MNYLYHGSTTQNIQTLEPRKRYTPQGAIDFSAIYATPSPAYAATHAFPWSSDDGVGLDIDEGGVHISIPARMKERLSVPVSIYKISSENFEHTKEELTGYTWHTTHPVSVIEEMQCSSVEKAFEALGVKYRYV